MKWRAYKNLKVAGREALSGCVTLRNPRNTSTRTIRAEALESFLQRLLFVSLIFVDAAGGEFIKWTGDGFLAWFETPLLRTVGEVAHRIFMAAADLTFWVNVTQLGVKVNVKFRIRHAVTLEHDALLIDLTHSGNRSSADVLGRAVVFAFRLSSIQAPHPCIVTQGELVKALEEGAERRSFKKLKLAKQEVTKYFKDELWGTKEIYVSEQPKPRRVKSLRGVLKDAKKAIRDAEVGGDDEIRSVFVNKLVADMRNGPDWTRLVLEELTRFIKEDFYGSLKAVIPVIEEAQKRAKAERQKGPATDL